MNKNYKNLILRGSGISPTPRRSIIKTNTQSNINFICYTQDLTGSYNIRQYNKLLVDTGKLYGKGKYIYRLTSYGRYCQLYDEEKPPGVVEGGNKKAEPFYDYLAVRIATSRKDEFQKDFLYEKVNFKQKRKSIVTYNTNNNSINVKKSINVNSKLKNHLKYTTKIDTTQLMLSVEGTGDKLNELAGYEGGEHIFILGPIPNYSINKILEKINGSKSNTSKKLFIHFQGETYDNWNKKINNKYYISNGGLFQSAFNIQGSIYNYLKLRNALKGANIYTVIPKETTNNRNKIPISNLNKANNITIKKTITDFNTNTPSVYKKYYKEIINFIRSNKLEHYVSNTGNNNSPQSVNGNIIRNDKRKLNIIQCHQDIYDKDNYISVVKIIKMASGKVELYLSGVPVYDGQKPLNFAPGKMKNNKFVSGPPQRRGVGINNHKVEYAKINKERTLDRHKKILNVWKQYMKQLPGKINNFTIKNTYNKSINSLISNPTPYITNYWKISNSNRNIYSSTSTGNNTFNKFTTNAILFHPNKFVDSLGFYETSLGDNTAPQLNFSGTGTPTLPNGRKLSTIR